MPIIRPGPIGHRVLHLTCGPCVLEFLGTGTQLVLRPTSAIIGAPSPFFQIREVYGPPSAAAEFALAVWETKSDLMSLTS